jgi:hypothetical protein
VQEGVGVRGHALTVFVPGSRKKSTLNQKVKKSTLNQIISNCKNCSLLLFVPQCSVKKKRVPFLIKATTLYSGEIRSYDPLLKSPRWQAETIPVDHVAHNVQCNI